MLKPYYEEPDIKIYCGDCLEITKDISDKGVDLILTDPPYGKQWARGKHGIGVDKKTNERFENLNWDKFIPTKEYFDEMIRVSKNQIIFGGNYFTNYLYPSNCWIVWDKRGNFNRGKQIPFADCELAWTSFNRTVRKYTFISQGFVKDTKDKRVHPTQKPSELFMAILRDYSDENDVILDPFLGSGTTLVACKELGRKGIGVDINKEYCDITIQRIKNVTPPLL